MPGKFDPANVMVLLAVGGHATRARQVTADAIPKHLIQLNGGPTVLEVVCRQLQLIGFRRFVFCTGYHWKQITDFVQSERWVTHGRVQYAVSGETEVLGLEGTILAGINNLGLIGHVMFMVADALIPWRALPGMNEWHAAHEVTLTWGLTSYVTERTADIGNVIVNSNDGRIARVYGRNEQSSIGPHELALTSAGVWSVSIEWYLNMCRLYKTAHGIPDAQRIGPNDGVVLWVIANGQPGIYGYDLQGEVIDLGTPDNIRFGQENWRKYILD